MIRYGLESIDNNLLAEMKKGLSVADIEKALKMTKKIGMRMHVTVMLGYPGETRETIRRTIDFVKRMDVDYAQFSIATPYPGTTFYSEMAKEGMLTSSNWSDYDGTCKVVVRLKDLEPKELTDIIDQAYREFYFRPRYVAKRLLGIRSFNEFRCALISALNLAKSQLART